MRRIHVFMMLVLVSLSIVGCGESNKVTEEKNASMLFSIYLTGSDLESGNNSGTQDLLELVEGYNALSKAQQETIEIQVVFGGANKEGWKGIKYTDIGCLKEDAQDGQFGNASCYPKEDPLADMGNPEVLTAFIEHLNSLGTYDTRMLTLWNHGGAYQGVCWDENSKNQLTLNELKTVLASQDKPFEIIGMDACLMANYSVAETLKTHASYLLASEELEPGHGWEYKDVIQTIGTQKDKNPVEIGKGIINSFVDTQSHKDTSQKTLSLIDLTKIDEITKAFDNFNESIVYSEANNFQATVVSLGLAKGYAVSEKGSLTQDFKSYLEALSLRLSEHNSSIQKVTKAIEESIVYNRYQEGMEGSYGLSLANPFYYNLNNKESNSGVKYREISELSNVWKKTINEFVGIQKTDVEKPIINNLERDCVDEGELGTCMDLSDDTSIESIHYNIFSNTGNDSYLKIGAITFNEVVENDSYFFPNQENKAYMLCDETQSCNFIPLTFKRDGVFEGKEYNQFIMEVTVDNKDAVLIIYSDTNDSILDLDLAFYTAPGLLGRPSLVADDAVINYKMDFYDLNGVKQEESIQNSVTAKDLKQFFTYQEMSKIDKEMKVEVNIALRDINGNITYSPIF